jgi:predicted amidohydrolase
MTPAHLSPARTMTISVIQFTAIDDHNESNLASMRRLLDVAGRRGSDLAVLPEAMTGCGASHPTAYQRIAEPIPGPTTDMLCAKAREHGMYITGSMFEQSEDGKIYNTAPLISPAGEIVGCYRKTHLFSPGSGPDIAHGLSEAQKITPGDSLHVFDIGKCRLGIAICADLRFHEVIRELALQGAEVIALPTAFPNPGSTTGSSPCARAPPTTSSSLPPRACMAKSPFRGPASSVAAWLWIRGASCSLAPRTVRSAPRPRSILAMCRRCANGIRWAICAVLNSMLPRLP